MVSVAKRSAAAVCKRAGRRGDAADYNPGLTARSGTAMSSPRGCGAVKAPIEGGATPRLKPRRDRCRFGWGKKMLRMKISQVNERYGPVDIQDHPVTRRLMEMKRES